MNGGPAAGTDAPQLPNPFTPLAWLPPAEVAQFENVRYLLLGILGAWIWDVLTSFPDEYSILFTGCKVKFPNVVYVFSRIITGCFIVTALAITSPPVHHCGRFSKLQTWAAAIQLPVNALLFFFRIRAVFFGQPFIIALFGLLWLSVAATSVIAPFSLEGVTIGVSEICLNSRLDKRGILVIVFAAVNDSFVFVAITTKLLLLSHSGLVPWSARLRSFFTGEGMGPIMRVMLQTGQLYYMTTVGFNIASAALLLSPSVPSAYANLSIAISALVTNVMATRVYRQLKLGVLYDRYTIDQLTALTFRSNVGNHASVPAVRTNVGQEQREERDIELSDILVGRPGRYTRSNRTKGL